MCDLLTERGKVLRLIGVALLIVTCASGECRAACSDEEEAEVKAEEPGGVVRMSIAYLSSWGIIWK